MTEALDRSNCGVARPRGKEAAVKPVSRRRFPKRPDGLTTREGPNLAGSGDPGWTGTGDDAEGLNRLQSQRGRDRVLRYPSGLSGTAGRGPARPVVWEPGGQSSRRPDFGDPSVLNSRYLRPTHLLAATPGLTTAVGLCVSVPLW